MPRDLRNTRYEMLCRQVEYTVWDIVIVPTGKLFINSMAIRGS